jgi:hypothetical protein
MSEPQILVKLHGGLGNNLYRFAAFETFKNQFDISLQYTGHRNINTGNSAFGLLCGTIYQNSIYSSLKVDFEYQSNIKRVELIETGPNYFEDFNCLLNENYYLIDGWYQNYNLFKNKTFVRNIFDFSKIQISTNNLKILLNEKCACLHVRRGDYVGIPHILPPTPVNYYNNAIDSIGDYDHLFIFSDDLPWCYNSFNYNKMTFVDTDELEALKMMTLCSKHIICNSSFSWWGAYLSDSEKVIMPNVWEGPGVEYPRPLRHYQCDGWQIIS